jgi:hypothetical protein
MGQEATRKLLHGLKAREAFFSEEKKQKTFMSLSRFFPAAYAKETKVFWFFFSKKNALLYPPANDTTTTQFRHWQKIPG